MNDNEVIEFAVIITGASERMFRAVVKKMIYIVIDLMKSGSLVVTKSDVAWQVAIAAMADSRKPWQHEIKQFMMRLQQNRAETPTAVTGNMSSPDTA